MFKCTYQCAFIFIILIIMNLDCFWNCLPLESIGLPSDSIGIDIFKC